MFAFRRSRSAAPVAALALLFGLLAGCGEKLDPKECDKIRGEAFELLNKAHHCATDADCRPSDWPGCEKPLNNANYDKIKPMFDKFKGGQCEEPKVDCKPSLEVYCKQGLCVHREKGAETQAPAAPK